MGSLTLAVRTAISEAGGADPRTNEDVSGNTSRAFWVLDGATAAPGQPEVKGQSGPRWYVRRLSEELERASDKSGSHHARSLLRSAINRLIADPTHMKTLRRGSPPPYASVSLMVLHEDHIEVLVMGDTGVCIRGPRGGELTRFGAPEQPPTGTAAQQREQTTWSYIVRDRLDHLNKPGGFWRASYDASAVSHAECVRLPVDALHAAVLFSDGFARAVDFFQLATWSGLVEADAATLQRTLAQLRDAERRSSPSSDFVRVKSHDDATIFSLKVS